MDHQLLLQCKLLKFRSFFLLFTFLMKLMIDTHITYFGITLNDVIYTANAQIVDSAISQFNSSWYIHFPKYMSTISSFFSMRITPITKDIADLPNMILN